MPNRIIKESICTSENIEQLGPMEEIFFYRLMVNCDDYGRMDARPTILRSKCFPLKVDKIKDKDVDKWLQSLSAQGLIVIYIVDNKPYLQMATWEKHQQRRARHSKYPAPDEGMISDDINCNQMQSNVPEESRNRGIEESRKEHGKFFEKIWSLYPNKKGKGQISDSKKRELYEIGLDTLKTCIDRYKKSKEDWQKWQHGSTFFNSGYIDYLDENYTPPPGQAKPKRDDKLTPEQERRNAELMKELGVDKIGKLPDG